MYTGSIPVVASLAPPAMFVLVRSLLVGPATWRPTADTLRARGHAAVVPARSAEPPLWPRAREAVARAAASLDGPLVLAGHSGRRRAAARARRGAPPTAGRDGLRRRVPAAAGRQRSARRRRAAPAAGQAREHGWPVAEIPGAHHLSIATQPDTAADALVGLVRAATGP